jgi:hypothetical protein
MRTPPGPAGLTVFPECDCSTPITAKHPLAQSNPARSPEENAAMWARVIFNKAVSLGIDVVIDGEELLAFMPPRLPPRACSWFAHWLGEFREEIADLGQAG